MPTFFLSDLFFRNPVRQDYSFPEEPRFTDNFARTLVRGLLVEKLEKDIAAKALQFQFNPTNITDKKTQNYFDRTRTGSATPDTVWVSGNPQKLSFELFLDATADSNTQTFQPSGQTGYAGYRELRSVEGVNLLEFGTLPQIERIKSMYYPVKVGAKPRFVTNSVQENNASRETDQFIPPPLLIFTYGPQYLEVKMTDLDITHELFNRKLAPIRSRCRVELTVKENTTINNDVKILNQPFVPADNITQTGVAAS